MKKLLLPIIALSVLITGCIGGDVYESPSSDRTYQSDLELITTNITVRPSQWVVDGTPGEEGTALISEWAVKELTQDVIDHGMVQVSYTFYDNKGILVEHPLPYILPWQGSPSNVLETFRCFFERGKITLVIESSDFQCYPREENYTFKVKILRYR